MEARALDAASSDSTEQHSNRVVSMSDIQQYLLDYDRNKKEASATAQRSANRTCGDWRGRTGRELMFSRTAERPIEAYQAHRRPWRILQ